MIHVAQKLRAKNYRVPLDDATVYLQGKTKVGQKKRRVKWSIFFNNFYFFLRMWWPIKKETKASKQNEQEWQKKNRENRPATWQWQTFLILFVICK